MAKMNLDRFKNKMTKFINENNKVVLVGLKKSSEIVRSHVVKNKLSGQVLNVKTNRLRNSIMWKVNRQDISAKVATNVKYAAVHEYGYPPRNIPERSYLRTGLEDKRNEITEIIADDIIRAYKKA